MRKDPRIFLKHILESIEYVENYTKGITLDKFLRYPQLQDAVAKRIEIIGEAVKNLPEDFKDKYPKVMWHKPMAMRNILIHEYFGIDLKLTWNTVEQILPEFKKQIKKILKDLKD